MKLYHNTENLLAFLFVAKVAKKETSAADPKSCIGSLSALGPVHDL